MLITFSPSYSERKQPADARSDMNFCAGRCKVVADYKFFRRQERGQIQVRFTLPGASFEAHDNVIRALLELDPGAEVRTAKAHYHGRDDFLRQFKATSQA